MIESFRQIQNVGQFDNVTAAAVPLRRGTLGYAENGRGKTTLTSILRSLATGDATLLTERLRLGAVHAPRVVIHCSGGNAVFDNGQWSQTLPDIIVFDDRFVDENVYSGLVVESGHRQKMHELILGAQGIALNEQVQIQVRHIETHNTQIRERAAEIPVDSRFGLNVDDFCALPAQANIDATIVAAERAIAAAQQQLPIQQTAAFDPLGLPAFDLTALEALLARDVAGLDAAAAERVRRHLDGSGRGAEAWVAEGMQRVGSEGHDCPFCAQSLAGSTVFQHYRQYFGDGYRQLRTAVTVAVAENSRIHSGNVQANFERAVRMASERRAFWARFCDVPALNLDTAPITQAWQQACDLVAEILEAKAATPLDRLQVPQTVRNALDAYNLQRQRVADVGAQLVAANPSIVRVKQGAVGANLTILQADLRRLQAVRARHDPMTIPLCDAYLRAVAAKAAAERARDAARMTLEAYRQNAFPIYQTAINRYLRRFNAGYRLDAVQALNNRGGGSCTYNVLINNRPVPINGAPMNPGQPSFRTVLSAGDRNTLALAFFFASIELDPNRARKIVVVDDPVSSLDEHRSLSSVYELRDLISQVQQLIVLSHSKPFLLQLWAELNPADRCSFQVSRQGTGSTLSAWVADNDAVTAHDRRHAMLRTYADQGLVAGQRLEEIASALRPTLEAFCRVGYPEHFPPGRLLGPFRGICEQRLAAGTPVLSQADIDELRELTDYGNQFHHDSNPAYLTVVINDIQLVDYTRRVLLFCKRT